MNEYYREVGKKQKKLSKKEEELIVLALESLRFTFRDTIYKIRYIRIFIKMEVKKVKSLATISEDFNSNTAGNNKSVSDRIKKIISSPNMLSNDLHKCNFRESWIIENIIPNITDDALITKLSNLLNEIRELENRLICSALKAAVKIGIECRGNVDIPDAIQLANIGLIDAARKFSSKEGTKFITYAYSKMKYKMKEANMDNTGRIIHIPRSLEDVAYSYGRWVSLDRDNSSENDKKSISLKEIIPSDYNLEEDVEYLRIRKRLREFLVSYLNSAEADVIYYRYLHRSPQKPIPYDAVSAMLDHPLSKERISQIETSAIKKLKGVRELKDYLGFFKGN